MPMKTIEGYSKEKYTNTSVLLAGGGAKALSDFIGSLSWDSTNKKIKYTPVGGSTTDLVTLSWDNITGKPFNWSGQSGQPSWLWGSNDGTNYYVWNPSNFSVNYANSAGNADTVDGYHASSFYQSKSLRSDKNSIYDLRYNYGAYDKGDYNGTYKDEYPTNYGSYLALASRDKNIGALMFIDTPTSNALGHIYVRTRGAGDRNTTYSEWGTLAYLTDNVASATYAASADNADTVDGQNFSYSNDSNSPTYLWGTNSNGSSFLAARGSISVNYANSAGSTIYITPQSYTPTSDTVGGHKDGLVNWLNTDSTTGIGKNIIISESIISQWDNDSAKPYPSSVYAMIKIGGGYNHSTYGQWLLSSYNQTRLGVVGRTGSVWSSIKWIAWTSDIPTKISQLTNDSGYITSSGSCNYANSAGNADTVDNMHASAFAHIGAHNNLTAAGNEFTFASSGFSGNIWINYRTAGGLNGNITSYQLGNGKGDSLGYILTSVNWSSYISIPSIGNGTVTVTQAGSPIGSFTMNQSGNTLIDLNDTNTNYYPIRSYTSGLQISSYSGSTDCALFVPYATNAIAGAVSTAAQSFAGQKTFLNGIKVGSTSSDQSTDNAKIYFGNGKYVWIGESPQDDALMLNCGTSKNIYFSFAGSTAVTSSNYSTYAKIYMSNSGAVYASSGFYESSDERLKKVVDTIKVNLDDLAKLRKIYYLWNNTPEDGRQLGMIAQDVQKLYPELVSMDKNTGYLSLAYDKLSVIALEAIDTLYEEYKQLKERINVLEKLLHSKEIL